MGTLWSEGRDLTNCVNKARPVININAANIEKKICLLNFNFRKRMKNEKGDLTSQTNKVIKLKPFNPRQFISISILLTYLFQIDTFGKEN